MKKLNVEQAELVRKKFTSDWEIRKGKYLYKKVAFDDYNQALRFFMVIEKPQVKLDHFADIGFFYNEVILMVYTHDVAGLTLLDFELAMQIDKALKQMDARIIEVLDEGIPKWFRVAFSGDPQFKAWYQMYKNDPEEAKRKFRSKHKEFLAMISEHTKLKEALGEIAQSTEIFVDMDGVLADFFGEWAKLMDVDHWSEIGKDNVPQALDKIRQTKNFWLDLPMTNNAKQLLGLIKDVKGEYKILSSPLPDDPNSEPHKREWIKNNLDFFPPADIIITHDKAKYATQQDGTPNILIDDYGVNIQSWEAAGGYGFKHKDHKFERTASAIKQHMQEPVEENFADGKVSGNSRPGRVKRAGASCDGSVTELRAKAKNASGERAKMYHWCANMKSGRS